MYTSLSFSKRAQDPKLCEERGYHGPFQRREEYAQVPGWEGMGDCLVCGSTRDVERNTARMQAAVMGMVMK